MLAVARPAAAAETVCLPENVALAQTPAVETDTSGASGNAAVYLDGSVSMQGFVRVDRGEQALYVDTVLGLRQVLEQVAGETAFNSFGTGIRPLDPTELIASTHPEFYVCNQVNKSGCDTRLDMVLEAVAASDDNALSVVATDLFLSDRDLIGSTFGTMRNSLQRVLRGGKSIGVMAITAAFNGVIYDLPGKKTKYTHQGKRPFFLLLIGGNDRKILKVEKIIEKQLLTDVPPERYRFALFTLHPAYPVTASAPLHLEPGNAIVRTERLPKGPPELPVLVLRKGADHLTSRQPLLALQKPFTAPLGNFKLSDSLWMYSDSSVCPTGTWLPWQERMVSAGADAGDLVVSLNPAALRYLPARKFLLRAKINAASTGKSEQLTGWLHDWGFGNDQVDKILKQKPDVFPVLNLGQLGDSLQSIIDDEFKPVTVADFLLAFRKDE
jgi:hypothetical protein